MNSFLAMRLYIFITGLYIFLYSETALAQNKAFTINENGARAFHQGSLVVKEGIPFLTVKGDSYEMGLQYGVLMNDRLLKMDHTVDSLIESYIGSFFIKKWIAGMVLNARIRKLEKKMPEQYIREMEGMAEGSDLNLKDLQIISYFSQLFFKISCTAFIMRNEHGLVHGRNLDWPGIEVLTHFPLIVNYHKKDKIPVTILTFVGYPGVYTGMNHRGLSMSINMNGTPAENDKEISDYNTGMPLAFKLRNILENTDNLNGVDQQFNNYSSHAWFITVGSREDNAGAIYELTRGEIIKNEMKSDFLFVENLALSDRGRYFYSPIWMFSTSNISRERKMKELYTKYTNNDLVENSYKILTNTENHHLSHDPFYAYSINNAITVKSCIMNNMTNEIYFTYGERLAALNKYLKYNPENGEVNVFKPKQEVADKHYLEERLKYQDWYVANISEKKKLNTEDYESIIKKVKNLKLEPAYKANLLSYYYSKLENHELSFKFAEEYIAERPDYYHSYYNKYRIMQDKGDYMDAIVALEEMLQTSTITPYYEYLAKVKMIEMYDRLLEEKFDHVYVSKISKLLHTIEADLNQYFIDKETRKDLKLIQSIEDKYKE